MERAGLPAAGRKALVLGSGGTSATARAALADMGARAVVTVSRRGPVRYGDLARHADAELLVNTTPVGMYPDNGAASPADPSAAPRPPRRGGRGLQPPAHRARARPRSTCGVPCAVSGLSDARRAGCARPRSGSPAPAVGAAARASAVLRGISAGRRCQPRPDRHAGLRQDLCSAAPVARCAGPAGSSTADAEVAARAPAGRYRRSSPGTARPRFRAPGERRFGRAGRPRRAAVVIATGRRRAPARGEPCAAMRQNEPRMHHTARDHRRACRATAGRCPRASHRRRAQNICAARRERCIAAGDCATVDSDAVRVPPRPARRKSRGGFL